MASDNKYDRQLRLWGAQGQKALMESRVCLFTAGPTGTETLKNLVLPGCGFITVVDPALVSTRDLGNNFFVTADSVGKPRAQVCLQNLLEMNDDVKGDFLVRDPLELIASNPAFLASYSLVIVTQMHEGTLRTIAAACWFANVPLLVARSYGFIGHLRIVKREHLIVESKLQQVQPSLRIARPFPALRLFCEGIDMAGLDDMTHRHVPYVVILIKALDAWKSGHSGASPRSATDKSAFKASVAAGERGPDTDAANFAEALKFAYFAWAEGVPAEVQEVLQDRAADELSAHSADFWFVVRAIRDFVAHEGDGELPLSGGLPDMTATTELFLALQRTYAARAGEDLQAVRTRVSALLASVGRPTSSIPDEAILAMCRNSASLRVVRYRSVEEEYGVAPALSTAIASLREELSAVAMEITCGMEDSSTAPSAKHPLPWYLALRAADRFAAVHERYPGSAEDSVEEDTVAVAAMLSSLVHESGLDEFVGMSGRVVSEGHAAEMVRAGAGELHSVAAVIGGLAAQEAVKLITGQYVPVENTFIFNGITGESGVYKL